MSTTTTTLAKGQLVRIDAAHEAIYWGVAENAAQHVVIASDLYGAPRILTIAGRRITPFYPHGR